MKVRLTERERDCADLLLEGLTQREIAGRLFLSEKTVQGHLIRAYHKAGFTRAVPFALWWSQQKAGVL